MTNVQYHKPQIGESVCLASGETVRIETVYYETERGVFRVTWLDPSATIGRRGCQITRGDGDDWHEWESPAIRRQA